MGKKEQEDKAKALDKLGDRLTDSIQHKIFETSHGMKTLARFLEESEHVSLDGVACILIALAKYADDSAEEIFDIRQDLNSLKSGLTVKEAV